MKSIPLEDTFADIVGKAMRGHRLTKEQLAQASGVEQRVIGGLLEGEYDESALRQVAPLLGLGREALVNSGRKAWKPAAISLDGLAQFNTPYEDMTVNSYLMWDSASGEAVAFDTGADATEMLDLIKIKQLKLAAILLTHTHGDHIFDLDRLKSRTSAPAYVGDREPIEGAETFREGRAFTCGRLQIETRLTWGHSKGGITYVVRGLDRPVAIVGDAVFAGSMGGGGVSYEDALKTNQAGIFTLSDETVICPGHGPLTTVGEERLNNPFFAQS